MTPSLDFGYPWWLDYGHLSVGAITGLLLAAGLRFQWGKWKLLLLAALTLWAGSVFLLIRFGVNINSVAALPTEDFLRSGTGKILDIGAGTGRSSIMVLAARPHVTLVASDLFGESFDQHFAPTATTPQQMLRANLKAAGVEQRTTIVTADMLQLPFEGASFDGIVSVYAMDHVGRDNSAKALREAARVLKPGGEFLLMVVNGKDPWLRFAFGPLLAHGGYRGSDWWESAVRESGLQVLERGTTPATFYILAKRELQ